MLHMFVLMLQYSLVAWWVLRSFSSLDFSYKNWIPYIHTQTQCVLLLLLLILMLMLFFSSFSPIFIFHFFFLYCNILPIWMRAKTSFFRYADVIFASIVFHIRCIRAVTIIKRRRFSYNVPMYGILSLLSQTNIFWQMLFRQTFVSATVLKILNHTFRFTILLPIPCQITQK